MASEKKISIGAENGESFLEMLKAQKKQQEGNNWLNNAFPTVTLSDCQCVDVGDRR